MNTVQAIEECLERIDHTRALLESQLTELHGLCRGCVGDVVEGVAPGLAGHVMGLAIVALRLNGATDDDIRMLLKLMLERDA